MTTRAIRKGLILGAPGVVGSPPVMIIFGSVAPSVSDDPDVAACQNGSLYIEHTTGTLYVKQSGAWVAK